MQPVSSSIAPVISLTRTQPVWAEPIELAVGELVMWFGKQTEHSILKNRIIYQCIRKEDAGPSSFATHRYYFRAVFDFSNPIGSELEPIPWMGTREMRRITLLDVCTLRLHFDNFIREWARLSGEPDPDSVR